MAERLLTKAETSERLGGVPEATLDYWAHIGYGPKRERIGRWVKYREADVDSFIRTKFGVPEPTTGAIEAVG